MFIKVWRFAITNKTSCTLNLSSEVARVSTLNELDDKPGFVVLQQSSSTCYSVFLEQSLFTARQHSLLCRALY